MTRFCCNWLEMWPSWSRKAQILEFGWLLKLPKILEVAQLTKKSTSAFWSLLLNQMGSNLTWMVLKGQSTLFWGSDHVWMDLRSKSGFVSKKLLWRHKSLKWSKFGLNWHGNELKWTWKWSKITQGCFESLKSWKYLLSQCFEIKIWHEKVKKRAFSGKIWHEKWPWNGPNLNSIDWKSIQSDGGWSRPMFEAKNRRKWAIFQSFWDQISHEKRLEIWLETCLKNESVFCFEMVQNCLEMDRKGSKSPH